MKHLRYLWYVIRHKWHVFLECCRLGIPWLGVIHDLSKFRPSQWFPYVEYFYGDYGKEAQPTGVRDAFETAWNHHQKASKHHWQYYLLVQDADPDRTLPMPCKYRKEMLADWIGAGKATGNLDTKAWYERTMEKRRLHPETQSWIEAHL